MFFNKKNLSEQIAIEFCWLSKQNDNYKIFINNELVDIQFNISNEVAFGTEIFKGTEDVKTFTDFNFTGKIIVWKNKPPEWSKFFFLDNENNEIFVKTTDMNRKKDNFYHSVYIVSDFFEKPILEDDDIDDNQLLFDYGKKRKLKIS
jgi:hypothetical protein